jgi:hypothetical protein
MVHVRKPDGRCVTSSVPGRTGFDLDRACDELLVSFADADRWSPHLTHLAALLRHALFSNPWAAAPALLELMEQIVPACSAYGAAVSVGDMSACRGILRTMLTVA